MTDLKEEIARALLNRRGFGFYLSPEEAGQDAYDLTLDALDEAGDVVAWLAKAIGSIQRLNIETVQEASGIARWKTVPARQGPLVRYADLEAFLPPPPSNLDRKGT